MNVGIIGCGNIASAHIKALNVSQDIKQIILFDLDETKLEIRANEANKPTRIATNIKELAEFSDCFIVCTPNSFHKTVIEEVLQFHHIPFLCEKPLAATFEDALIINEIAPKDSIISFNYRFNSIFTTIKKYIDKERLGQCLFFNAEFNKNSALTRKELTWRDSASQSFSSGALGDLSCHLLDLFCWLTNSSINMQSIRIASGTRIKEKQNSRILVDDNGYILGEGNNNTFFKIKASKSEDENSLGLHIHLIFSRLEILYSTKMPYIIQIKKMDNITGFTIELENIHMLTDPKREIPYWADSFVYLHKVWFDKLIRKRDNSQMPSLVNALHIQKIISHIEYSAI